MWYEEACGEFCELRGAHCERLPAFSIVAGFIRTTTRAPPENSRSAGTPFSPKRLRSSNLTTTYAAALADSIVEFRVTTRPRCADRVRQVLPRHTLMDMFDVCSWKSR